MPEWSISPILEWISSAGRKLEDDTEFVHELAKRLDAVGASVDRLNVTIRTLNPRIVGTTIRWFKQGDRVEVLRTEHQVRNTDRYIGSPMQQLFTIKQPIHQRLDQLPHDAHKTYTDLAAQGFTDYLAFPIVTSDGLISTFIVNTKAPAGYSDHDVQNFRTVLDYLAPILEVYSLRYLSSSLMRTYVGKRTGEKVLSGMIMRGDADIISAALWFSDLRDFSHLSETLPPQQVLELLNTYFEFVSAAVTARGGEILKFVGDAMLIVFPISDTVDSRMACRAALDSAIDAQDTLSTLNHRQRHNGLPEIEFGVGLNVGEVVYGNIGAPDRLDFTVIGPAVNRTARLESLTKELNTPILCSGEFAQLIENNVRSLGFHEMKGIGVAPEVFGLASDND